MHPNLAKMSRKDYLGALSPSQRWRLGGQYKWGGPGCLLSLDWLRPMVSMNLSFPLCKWLMMLEAFQELVIPRGLEVLGHP